jgi:putative acetyltransferase
VVFSISAFTIDRYDDVLALWKECEGIGLSGADSREGIRLYLERNPGTSFIAHSEAKLVGAALAGHDARRGYIHHLAVHPDYRRQGLGRLLAGKCVDALREAGIVGGWTAGSRLRGKCHIFIFNSNTGGIAFWKSMDWTLREDVSLMSKDIDPAL